MLCEIRPFTNDHVQLSGFAFVYTRKELNCCFVLSATLRIKMVPSRLFYWTLVTVNTCSVYSPFVGCGGGVLELKNWPSFVATQRVLLHFGRVWRHGCQIVSLFYLEMADDFDPSPLVFTLVFQDHLETEGGILYTSPCIYDIRSTAQHRQTYSYSTYCTSVH